MLFSHLQVQKMHFFNTFEKQMTIQNKALEENIPLNLMENPRVSATFEIFTKMQNLGFC